MLSTPKKRINDMTCEELRSSLKKLRRKTTGAKDELRSELHEVFQQNDRGWDRKMQSECTKIRYLDSGEFRNVELHRYTKGPNKGELCVWKVFKTGSVYDSTFFTQDIKAVDKAAEIIGAFNRYNQRGRGCSSQMIYLNRPEVWSPDWTTPNAGKKGLVEPYLPQFRKFNSNTGWSDSAFKLMGALSHFSYDFTDGKYLLCDLQGERSTDMNYILTDPVILSTSGEFGATDGGVAAMESFFAHHQCNEFCNCAWKRVAGARAHFAAKSGTTFFHR